MIVGLGTEDGKGCRIRLVPPAPSGALDPHTPTVPVFAGSSSAPGMFTGTYRTSSRVRIGRALDNDIVVDDLLVSRHHAQLRTAHTARTS